MLADDYPLCLSYNCALEIGTAMNIRVILLIGILFTTNLFAREKTDVLVMKNGDRMTCQIKGLEAGVLYVSFDYIDGTAQVEWSKVARRRKQGALYRKDGGRLGVHG